jgi:hypothetical protein
MQIKQNSFCGFTLEFKNGSVNINPTKQTDSDIKIFSINNSPYLNYSSNDGELTIKNAGEFEVKDIFVTGKNTNKSDSFVYTISSEDLTIGVISFINDLEVIPEDFFESTDVLLIGAGGGPLLNAKDANKIVETLSPAVAVFFGFSEQAIKELKDTLDSVEEVKKDIPGLSMIEKTLKLDRDFVAGQENTINYYFGE